MSGSDPFQLSRICRVCGGKVGPWGDRCVLEGQDLSEVFRELDVRFWNLNPARLPISPRPQHEQIITAAAGRILRQFHQRAERPDLPASRSCGPLRAGLHSRSVNRSPSSFPALYPGLVDDSALLIESANPPRRFRRVLFRAAATPSSARPTASASSTTMRVISRMSARAPSSTVARPHECRDRIVGAVARTSSPTGARECLRAIRT